MKEGVLFMSFGAVERIDDVPQYYANIRGGRMPSEDKVADLRNRYQRIGGTSPLVAICRKQAARLETALHAKGHDVPVEVGMRFWNPTIDEGVQALVDRGVDRIIGITSGPYDSAISVAAYERQLKGAVERFDSQVESHIVRHWFDAPGLDEAWSERHREALTRTGWDAESCHVLLTCHALPERIMVWNDPYPRQFQQHAARLAKHLGLRSWGMCYQSAGLTEERWLGPDILQALEAVRAMGKTRVLVMPIGFSADHLEILHDLDIEAQAKAETLGLEIVRAPSLNDLPAFIAALQETVTAALHPSVRSEQSPLSLVSINARSRDLKAN